nr:MAG TPA: hypothetical protein [Caudoviricetes sp.]
MKKYNVYKATREINEREISEIVKGCAFFCDGVSEELIKSCDTLEEAKEVLVKYKTDITAYDGCYLVTEYCILPEIYDEDGEIVESGDTEEITEMKITVEDEEWNVVKTFDNLKEADDFVHNDERELTLVY